MVLVTVVMSMAPAAQWSNLTYKDSTQASTRRMIEQTVSHYNTPEAGAAAWVVGLKAERHPATSVVGAKFLPEEVARIPSAQSFST